MIRSPGFGSRGNDNLSPSFRTRFRVGSGCFSLTFLPLPLSRRLILQQARGQLLTSHSLSAYGFMFYFTPYTRVLFTFPSQYYFTIGHPGVFSLTRWSSLIHTGFHVSHATRDKTLNFRKKISSGNFLFFFILTTGLSPSLVQDSAVSFYFKRKFLAGPRRRREP